MATDGSGPFWPGGPSNDESGRELDNFVDTRSSEEANSFDYAPFVTGVPLRALAGFQRIPLAPHASQTVTFTLSPRELGIVDPDVKLRIPAGPVELWLGSGQFLPGPSGRSPNGRSLKLSVTSSSILPN